MMKLGNMKSNLVRPQLDRRNRRRIAGCRTERGGSTLVVVAALLGLLALLGFMIFKLTNQELESATYFAGGAKELRTANTDPNIYFDYGLEQLILGAPSNRPNSALYGGPNSMLPTLVGRDVRPYDGQGVHLTTRGGMPRVDQNHDGNADGDQSLLNINHSPAANGGTPPSWTGHPEPDVDYTSPDINTPFLSFVGYALDDVGRPVRVEIPSFHRPQYLRRVAGVQVKPIVPWHSDASTAQKVLAPHFNHVDAVSGVPRFIIDSADATAAGATGPFPFVRANQGVWSMRIWTPNTSYEQDEWVIPPSSNGWFYKCTTAGSSSNVEPNSGTWPTGEGAPVIESAGVEWEAHDQPDSAYYVDADGDGIKEAVWLDLDFPVQELGDGTKYIPLFAFTVRDADGLGNVNVHGRLNGDTTITGSPFGGGDFVSKSNQGLSPSEINLQWLLNAKPGSDMKSTDTPATVFEDLVQLFAHTPSNFREASNMEWFLAKVGRVQYSSGVPVDVFEGVYGEMSRLSNGYASKNSADFPFPGRSQFDDNGNLAYGDGASGQLPFYSPLDWYAAGTAYQTNGKHRLFYSPTNNLNRWARYQNVGTHGVMPWATLQGNELMVDGSNNPIVPGNVSQPLLDDPEEVEFDPRLADTSLDRLLAASEMFFLTSSNTDYLNVGGSSRIEKLLNWNLVRNLRAKEIRKRLTTRSFDPRFFGMSRPAPTAANGFRPWEFTLQGTNSLGDPRYVFPPEYPNAKIGTATDPFRPALRSWLKLFAGDIDSNPAAGVQRLLSINHYLDSDPSGSNPRLRSLTEHPGSSLGATVIHELGLPTSPSTPIPSDSSMSSVSEREHYARLMRQRMARDIYVMLYTFCGGESRNPLTTANTIIDPDPDGDPTTNDATRVLYDDRQLEAMARFAINTVDRLDRDHIIDAFEYDKNLADGWGLDDDPYAPNPGSPFDESTANRGVVYGVEEQELTLSEAMAYRFRQYIDSNSGNPMDHRVTEFDDTQDRYFTYVELRNASPRAFSLNGNVRIEVETTDGTDTWIRRLTLLQDDPAFATPIPGGGLFTILSAGDDQNRDPMTNDPLPSYVMLDLDLPANLMGAGGAPVYDDRLAPLPLGPVNLGPTTFGRNVDLIVDDGNNRFLLQGETNGVPDSSVPVGGFLNATNIGGLKDGVAGATVKFRLYRRAHPARATPTAPIPANYDRDNPWIPVDEFTIRANQGYGDIAITMKDDDAGIIQHVKTELKGARSFERVDPLARTGSTAIANPEVIHSTNGEVTGAETNPNHDKIKLNTIAADNKNSGIASAGDTFTLWQLPADRDFASSIELLSIPMYGPEDLTKSLDPQGSNTAGTLKFLRPRIPGAYGADGKPGDAGVDDDGNGIVDDEGERGYAGSDDPDPLANPEFAPKQDNRWHRLLGFAGAPARNTPLDRFRVPGKVNLNMLRHPEMLVAMLDDPAAVGLSNFNPLDPNSNQMNYLTDAAGEAGRDWWIQFLQARDQLDSVTGMYLPAMAHARPFRSLSYLNDGTESIAHTLLRPLPLDSYDPGRVARRLFELRTEAEQDSSTPSQQVDHHTRHRLLGKMANYSTTRSNVFTVYLEVGFFEVVEPVGGGQRIGAEVPSLPHRRAFFVIDRSLAVEKLKAADFRPPTDSAKFSIKSPSEGGFDWRELVLHRQLIK